MKLFSILALALLFIAITCMFYSCSRKSSSTLLTDNKVYKWKVYHVTENNYPAGIYHYFEVFYGDRKLVLPKEMTGGIRDVSRFLTAGGYDNSETHYDSVLITFQSFTKDEHGFEQRGTVNISIRPNDNDGKSFAIYNLCTGKTATLELSNL